MRSLTCCLTVLASLVACRDAEQIEALGPEASAPAFAVAHADPCLAAAAAAGDAAHAYRRLAMGLSHDRRALADVIAGFGEVEARHRDVVAACSPPLPMFTIGGTISGVQAGAQLTLRNNGGDDLVFTGSGAFRFNTALPDGSAYEVTVFAPPSGQACTVSNGSGFVAGANVTEVLVQCADVPFVGPGDIVISEIMSDPLSIPDTEGEWFEVQNTTTRLLDLNGLTVRSDVGVGFTINRPLFVGAGQRLLFALRSVLPYDGVVVDYVYTGLVLANASGQINIMNGTTLIDRVAYDASWPALPGHSKQLDPFSLNAVANDVSTSWCDSQTILGGGDFGTPGGPNVLCL